MKKLIVLLSLAVVIMLVAACGQKAAPSPTATTAAPKPATSAATSAATSTAPSPSPKATTAAPAKVYNWKLATYMKEDEIRFKQLREWVDAVTKASNGAIKITIYPADTLVKQADYPDALSRGIVEMVGTFTPSGYAGIVPVASTVALYNPKDYSKFLQDPEVMRILNKEAVKFNSFYLGFEALGGNEFFSSKPFASPEDMKGKLIRVTGGIYGEFVKVWGGQTVSMPVGELYTAGQRGVMDGCGLSIQSYVAQKIYEVFPYVLQSAFERILAMGTINLDVWKSLTPDLQKVLLDTRSAVLLKQVDEVKAEDDKLLNNLVGKGLIKIQTLSPESRAEWVKRVSPAFVAEFKKYGPIGEEMVQYLQKNYGL